jgi:pyruvate kinase
MIIEKCNLAGKAVITATQMLDSMIRNPRPTRAEASDVANAIFDGTDAIMLSGETANGNYPVETLRTMARIAERTESALNYEAKLKTIRKNHVPNVPNAISLATCNTAMDLNASAIITVTQSGHTARMVSKYKPECPIIAVTPYESVARKLALNWGVFPIISPKSESTDELIESSAELALKTGYVKKGDLVVIAAGIPSSYVGATNMLKVHIIGDILITGKGLGEVMAFGNAYVAKSYKEAVTNLEDRDILIVKDLEEEYIGIFDKVAGVITEKKVIPPNVAIECLSREIPVIFSAEGATDIIKTGSFITMDIRRGIVYSGKANIK